MNIRSAPSEKPDNQKNLPALALLFDEQKRAEIRLKLEKVAALQQKLLRVVSQPGEEADHMREVMAFIKYEALEMLDTFLIYLLETESEEEASNDYLATLIANYYSIQAEKAVQAGIKRELGSDLSKPKETFDIDAIAAATRNQTFGTAVMAYCATKKAGTPAKPTIPFAVLNTKNPPEDGLDPVDKKIYELNEIYYMTLPLEELEKHPEWLLTLRFTPQTPKKIVDWGISALGLFLALNPKPVFVLNSVFTFERYHELWKAFFKTHKKKIYPGSPLMESIQAFWEEKEIPRDILKLAGKKPVERLPQGTVEAIAARVKPIIEPPEVNYAPPQSINSRCKGRHLEISTSPWPAGTFLHLVVRGVARSRKTQNTTIYCFATWEELQKAIIEKPQNFDYQVSGFLCDRSTAFPNANSTSGVPEEFWCETRKIINPATQVATEIKPPVTPNFTPVLPGNLRTPLERCQPCVEAMDLANELDWQTHLAEQLIEYIDKFEEIFASIQLEGDLITFEPRTGGEIFNCLEAFTVDPATLKIVEPSFKALSPDLDDELMGLLVSWAQAKQEKSFALEKREKHRREISEWRQANEFRKAKGKACREALSFKPWEEYQQGVHKGAQGFEIPIYAWDKACVLRKYLPRVQQLFSQLEKAGIKVSFEKAVLESRGQRDVVLDGLEFEISEVGLTFQLKINREAESSSDIFTLEFDDATPESWRNEAARWAIGTVCMMGIITLPTDKSPLNAGKKDRPNDASHFSFKAERKQAKSSKDVNSSYLNLVNRLNNKKGRIKSIADSRGFVWDGSWADFADAGLTVYQNAFFREEKHFDAAKSQVDYDLILNDERWQKYTVLRLWQTLKQGGKIEALSRRSSVGAYSKNMTRVALEAWDLLSEEEQNQFIEITSPTEAAKFTFTHGEAENCNFIRTLMTLWQKNDIGLFVQTEPVYVSFETVMQHCQKEGVIIVARSEADLDALEELGLPDLKIETAF